MQALQDILDDDDDIGAMYLSRKARAKEQAASNQRATTGTTGAPGGGDDEVLVASAEEQARLCLSLPGEPKVLLVPLLAYCFETSFCLPELSDMELLVYAECGFSQTNGEDSYTEPHQASAVQPLAAASVGRTASAPPGPVERMAPASPFASQSVSPRASADFTIQLGKVRPLCSAEGSCAVTGDVFCNTCSFQDASAAINLLSMWQRAASDNGPTHCVNI